MPLNMSSKSRGLLWRLREREIACAPRGTQLNRTRILYQHVFPNYTIYDVGVPPTLMRKFTPDGKHLLCISRNQQSLEMFSFRTPALSFEVDDDDEETIKNLGSVAFNEFFNYHYQKVITRGPDLLNKDFALFVHRGKYVILASQCPSPSSAAVNDHRHHPDSLNCFSNHEDTTFYIVEISSGEVTDKWTFKADFISLNRSFGVHIYNDLMAVLSLQNQVIHIFQVKDCGTFVQVRSVGPFCYEDDELWLSMHRENTDARSRPLTADSELRPHVLSLDLDEGTADGRTINGMKHRILTFLYRQAVCKGTHSALRHFFLNFNALASLCMLKVQLVDERHLLVKFGNMETVQHIAGKQGATDTSLQTAIMVFYDMVSTNVIGVFDNGSRELLDIVEKCSDYLKLGVPHTPVSFLSTCSSSLYFRDQLRKQQYAVRMARNGGNLQANRRVLALLPFGPQSNFESPYFDPSLFSYDEKVISASDRPKLCGDSPVKFYARSTGSLVFKLNSGQSEPSDPSNRGKRYAAYIFHPVYPFVISVQHTINQPPLVNIHFRRP
eukprot:Colp12_sorted_trinity150504_noHs@32009